MRTRKRPQDDASGTETPNDDLQLAELKTSRQQVSALLKACRDVNDLTLNWRNRGGKQTIDLIRQLVDRAIIEWEILDADPTITVETPDEQ